MRYREHGMPVFRLNRVIEMDGWLHVHGVLFSSRAGCWF